MNRPVPGEYIRDDGETFRLLYVAKDITTGLPSAVYRPLEDEDAQVLVCPLSAWRGYRPLDKASAPTEAAPQPSEDRPLPDKRQVLKRYFGYDEFRDGQETLIDSIISGRDTVGVMPTGAGKSICYQVPALMLPGCTLVVSPLISLMKDQVAALKQAGVPAAYLNSSLTARQMELALENALNGAYKIIYVAPERLETQRFQYIARQLNISLIAVDEAHCISQWGQDFRPSYLAVPDFIDILPERPRVCAFTATATRRVREDIVRIMRLKREFMCVTGFDRPNLYYRVLQPQNKQAALMAMIAEYGDKSGIVYCATRKDVDAIWGQLALAGAPAARYHAGLSDMERRRSQEDFTEDRARIMVATNAFGMGIDKSDVRFVIHYSMPGDLESYYQEAGRAGRDGESAECTLLYGRRDIITQRFFIEHMGEESELSPDELRRVQTAARRRLTAMVEYCETQGCLRGYVLNYFGEDSTGRCGDCSCCAAEDRDPYEDAPAEGAPRRKKSRATARDDTPMDAPLFERLRTLRQRLAAARGIPAYVVFTDATLKHMSDLKPRNEAEFLKVSGVGVAKQREYGRDFLREIEKYMNETQGD
jgi:ATP-dependent DNA helicase RecQ